jgi:hypothetical protein
MLGNSFQTNYVLLEPRNTKPILRLKKSEGRAYYLGAAYGYRKTEECLDGASKGGYLEAVKYLVSQGADIHSGNDHALRVASGGGHLEVTQYLIGVGANVHAENDDALGVASGGVTWMWSNT